MPNFGPHIQPKTPVALLQREITIDLKEIFVSSSKICAQVWLGKPAEALAGISQMAGGIGLKADPAGLAYDLIRRSLIQAIAELAAESARHIDSRSSYTENEILTGLNYPESLFALSIDARFFYHPGDIALVSAARELLEAWLIAHAVAPIHAANLSARLPSYFTYALCQECRLRDKEYAPLLGVWQNSFTPAGERALGWTEYNASLERATHESVFGESFSLRQLYIPLNAWYCEGSVESRDDMQEFGSAGASVKTVVSLSKELHLWLAVDGRSEPMRVISGGPGSGKSSFARMFAAEIASKAEWKTLYVPLHLLSVSSPFYDSIGEFVTREGKLRHNPLDPQTGEARMLILLDGLDELFCRGESAVRTATEFIEKVSQFVETYNRGNRELRILFCGREIVVQQAEAAFHRPRQVLTLLPFYLPSNFDLLHLDPKARTLQTREAFDDPDSLLEANLRDRWWEVYGMLTGRGFPGLPEELHRDDLDELTTQPLLNYLVALSFSTGKIDFSKGVNLNSVYADLVVSVHERAYERHRRWNPIRHMRLEDFARVLEEVALATWHGNGRTTTIAKIEELCRRSGIVPLLGRFEEGAKEGVTRLLAAFFFGRHDRDEQYDPTFLFTHKTFGEYFAAKRLLRAAYDTVLHVRAASHPDRPDLMRTILVEWARLTGPSPMTPYILSFLRAECELQEARTSMASEAQQCFSDLFSYVSEYGMPMEELGLKSFREQMSHSRNAEEALLATLNAFALVTETVSPIRLSHGTAFGAWLKRIQGQYPFGDQALVMQCLSWLNLSRQNLRVLDFGYADLDRSILVESGLSGANFSGSTLQGTDLRDANARGANFSSANLSKADLRDAICSESDFSDGNLQDADLTAADFSATHLKGARLEGAVLEGTSFSLANIEDVHLDEGVTVSTG